MSESRLVVPARYDRIKELCEFVVQAAEDAGLSESEIFHCQIAVDEACTNIIEHGYTGEDKGKIEIQCQADSGQLEIEILDDAPPFDPDGVPEPKLRQAIEEMAVGGLGIYFMKKMMDEVAFSRLDGKNRLTMVKRHSADAS